MGSGLGLQHFHQPSEAALKEPSQYYLGNKQ